MSEPICAQLFSLSSADRSRLANRLPDISDDVDLVCDFTDGALGALEFGAILLQKLQALVQHYNIPVHLFNILLAF